MTEPDVLTPREARGCSIALAIIIALAIAAYLLCGCTSYTVLPADREAIPVRQVQDNPRTYVEAVDGATGWYVPDATMLDLLKAD